MIEHLLKLLKFSRREKYHPERHYMRGAGPKSKQKSALTEVDACSSAADAMPPGQDTQQTHT